MKRLFKLAEDKRTPLLNNLLGAICAFVSGAINAGGFISLGQYTSHITGVVATAADSVALQNIVLAIKSVGFVFQFFLGAFFATLLIQYAQTLKLHSRFALAFLVNGCVLVFLGIWTWIHPQYHSLLILELGLFFSMGIQNATVTQLSNYELRATHMTGIVTDLGIETSKWIFDRAIFDSHRIRVLLLILTSFFIGGLSGAFSFKSSWGTLSLIGYGGVLIFLAIFPVYKDTHIRMRYFKHKHKK